MKREFSTDEVVFDSSVNNPSRIWRLYGTVNRKGEPTVERPHRRAEIVIPHRWPAVSPEQVYGLAAFFARQHQRRSPASLGQRGPVTGAGDYRTLNAVTWFQQHGLYRRPLGSGKHAVACPWDTEHSSSDPDCSTATVIWEAADSWPTFHCSHAHCDGRGIRDVMALWGDADRYCGRAFQKVAA